MHTFSMPIGSEKFRKFDIELNGEVCLPMPFECILLKIVKTQKNMYISSHSKKTVQIISIPCTLRLAETDTKLGEYRIHFVKAIFIYLYSYTTFKYHCFVRYYE